MNETLIIAKWLLVFLATGLVGSMLFISENSKMLRYAVGKALGVVLLAGLTWLLSLSHILPFTSATVWAVLLIISGAVLYFRHKYISKFFKQNYRQIILIESILIGLFLIFINIRMFAPKIEGIEKFMDMAILTGLLRHRTGIPLDTWYAPSDINYYYFGHWIVAAWAKLSFVSANYAFNLGFASVLSLVGTMIFAIVQKLSGKIWAGFVGVFLALFASNIFAFMQIFSHTTADFFKTGRFVDEVINEYPLYSVVLGDLHAHMLGLVLSVALFGVVVVLASEKQRSKRPEYAILGGLLGVMAITNSFDIVNCGVLLALYFGWELFIRKSKPTDTVRSCIYVAVPFGILLLISMLTFSPAVSGIQISIFKTPLVHIFWQFGAVLLILLACILALFTQPKPKAKLMKFTKSYQFMAIIFAVAALAIILLTELIYFKDIYHYANPPYARANTQFKMWYGAWIMLAIASASLLGISVSNIKNRILKILLIICAVVLIFIASIGTINGYKYLRNSNLSGKRLIDGTHYIQDTDGDKMAVIMHVNQQISGQPVILQNGGDSYSANSWLSSYTGTASYLGWRSHEWGWRYDVNAWGTISKKFTTVQSAYEASTPQDLRAILKTINAEYLLLGPDENSAYKVNKQNIIDTIGSPVFTSGLYELYKVPN